MDDPPTAANQANTDPNSVDGSAVDGNPPSGQVAAPASVEPQRLPDDHPLVTAFAAQKSKNADLQAQVDQIPATVAAQLRTELIKMHQIDEQTAKALITGTTPEQVLAQVDAVAGLTRTGTAPKMGTTTPSPPAGDAAFAAALFGGKGS